MCFSDQLGKEDSSGFKRQQYMIRHVELVALVNWEDALWEDDQTVTVARVNHGEISNVRREELETRLDIGKGSSPEERRKF